jgi:hypothetical protein
VLPLVHNHQKGRFGLTNSPPRRGPCWVFGPCSSMNACIYPAGGGGCRQAPRAPRTQTSPAPSPSSAPSALIPTFWGGGLLLPRRKHVQFQDSRV